MTVTIELFRDVNGCWRWRLRASNAEILATSEAYSSKTKARQTAKRLAEATGLKIKETAK